MSRHLKKTLVFEPFVGGHYTNYVEALCEHVCSASELRGQQIIFVVDERLLEDERISRFTGLVEFDTISLGHRYSPSFSLRNFGSYFSMLRELWSEYIEALERHLPEFAIIPSADHLTQASLFFASPRMRPKTTAMLHQSRAGAVNAKEYVKRQVYESIWSLSPWDRILLVNPQTFYERIDSRKNKNRYGLSPDPIPKVELIDRHEARHRLGLDLDLDYVGIVGSLGVRLDLKAIFEAFKAAKFDTGTKLLLAGTTAHQAHRELIKHELRDTELRQGVIFLDRYLSKTELHSYYRACNVVAPYYHDTSGLSANLLLAVSANVPALVADHGFGQWLVDQFPHIGVSSPRSSEIMAKKLRELLKRSKKDHSPSGGIKRLLEFNSPQNFAHCAFSLETRDPPYSV